jgi:hypothetical protein
MNIKKFEVLLNEELSIINLSNELQQLECEDICFFKNWEEILQDKNMVVATDQCGEEHIQIFFEIIFEAGEDEVIEATIIKIVKVEEY